VRPPPSEEVLLSAIWTAVEALPASLEQTLAAARELDAGAAILGRADRVVVTGNGASHYAGVCAALAALETPVDVQAVPSGLLGKVAWREHDATLAVSVSGEFRDLVDAVEILPRPLVVVTAGIESTLARVADLVVPLAVEDHPTETHPQDFCNASIACLALLARLADDRRLRELVESVPGLVARTIDGVATWVPEVQRPEAAVCAGHGAAWAGALELALLLKEIARVPAEGVETREAATSALTGLHDRCLVVALASGGDPFLAEAQELWRSSGAAYVEIPFGRELDPRVVPIVSFPAGAALAVALARRAGLDADHPWWVDSYLSTARAHTR
jgi:glucosamine 6-phosphate synthetase-like amidotransferase/phosphosugar isomerase protein